MLPLISLLNVKISRIDSGPIHQTCWHIIKLSARILLPYKSVKYESCVGIGLPGRRGEGWGGGVFMRLVRAKRKGLMMYYVKGKS